MQSGSAPRITIVAGPTASGKSGFALDMALEKKGAIINADSMQIYAALPILTAQPTVDDQFKCPHYLYGHLPPTDQCAAPRWTQLAIEAVEDAFANGWQPIIVGGTGFYLKTLIDGISKVPQVSDETRAFARQLLQMIGPAALHELLRARDPVTAARIHPNDSHRVLRAWEVIEGTGKSLTEWQSEPPAPPRPDWVFDINLLLPDRDVLYRNCDLRLDTMVATGALDEIVGFEHLLRSGQVPPTTPCIQALGYQPLRAYLAGEKSREDALTEAKAETRQYAKRQTTWFKHQLKQKKNIARIETIY
jgi:tRNA dimethylallyltransferase